MRKHSQQAAESARRAVTDRAMRPAPKPPEGIAPARTLAAHARRTLTGATRVARWAQAVGTPSKVAAEEAAEQLGVTSAEIVADWARARLAGLIELHGGRARPGWRLRAWDSDDGAVLRGWVALFDAWSFAHPAPETQSAETVAEVIEAMPQLLALLHLTGGPVREPVLLDILRQRVAEIRTERCEVPYGDEGLPVPGGAGPVRADDAALPGLLDWALTAFASVGALVRAAEGEESTLTPLGHWAVWTKIEQICVAAQSPAGGNIEAPAAAMLRGCAGLTPRPARAEYRAWFAARPTAGAVAELLEAARGDDALLRGLAFEALRVAGAAGEQAVRGVLGEPVLRPYALLWLAEQEGVDPEDAPGVLSREEATWLWVDTAAAVADHGEGRLLVRHLDSALQPTVPELLAEVRAVGHPRTVQVLVALAAAHPDPALAKAVRKAAFEVHVGGA
ncbi:hypothetical protein SRB5_24210 [Streptomyces sp. RB5]|uniref:Uncharacterized protein n=1 Tax=Streptomyces smaragdinus TaxID=2585196 RepID=A0A7K0CFQ0_9ACTN|nr:hypothetical protein [Streptomyces smaragdinus]